jgi:hypothetical protein
MASLLEWLHVQSYLLTLAQIVLDLLLIILVLVFLTRRPKSVAVTGGDELLASFDRVLQETKEIAGAFDVNLEERQQLIQQVLGQLDARLEDAKKTVEQLQSLHSAPPPTAPQEPPMRSLEQQEVLRLARQGLDADTIAQQLKKHRGEVELILKLHRLGSR